MRGIYRTIRTLFDEGVYVMGLSATAFGAALALEGGLIVLLGP